jgi:hypothetical protein
MASSSNETKISLIAAMTDCSWASVIGVPNTVELHARKAPCYAYFAARTMTVNSRELPNALR